MLWTGSVQPNPLSVQLNESEIKQLEAPYVPHAVTGHADCALVFLT